MKFLLHNTTKILGVFTLMLFLCNIVFAQQDTLHIEIEKIAKSKNVKIGYAVKHLENQHTFSYNGMDEFPMQSVYKFPLALKVLSNVDSGLYSSLDEKFFVSKDELHVNTWSPIRHKYPNGNTEISLRELLFNSISHSDNNACDILFRIVGGPAVVDNYVQSIGIKGISVAYTVTEMREDSTRVYNNLAQPYSLLLLLEKFYKGQLLKENTNAFLYETMTQTTTGRHRIRALLPKGTVVADKTGSSGPTAKGVLAVTNDIGIITMPNGSHIAIVVLVSTTEETEDTCQNIIARIAKFTYDYFLHKK